MQGQNFEKWAHKSRGLNHNDGKGILFVQVSEVTLCWKNTEEKLNLFYAMIFN